MESRWRLRFDNLQKAYARLQYAAQVVVHTPGDELLQAGLIQTYEFTFELAWKTLKDFLSEAGFDVRSPRETIRTAFQNGYITDGDSWMQALEDRNLTTHTYDQGIAAQVEHSITQDYAPMIGRLIDTLRQR